MDENMNGKGGLDPRNKAAEKVLLWSFLAVSVTLSRWASAEPEAGPSLALRQERGL